MDVTFRPARVEEYGLMAQFKRATAVDATGRSDLFDKWFPAERPFEAFVAGAQAFAPEGCTLVEVDGMVVGHLIMFMRNGHIGKLNNIYLLPEWRGRGLGMLMDAQMVGFFRIHGASHALLTTNPANASLFSFMRKLAGAATVNLMNWGWWGWKRISQQQKGAIKPPSNSDSRRCGLPGT